MNTKTGDAPRHTRAVAPLLLGTLIVGVALTLVLMARVDRPEEPLRDASPVEARPGERVSPAEVAFWESIKDSQEAADFQAYLAQHPDGYFARLAHNRLGSRPDERVSPAEVAYWESIKDSQDAADFQAYLARHPDGYFARLARSRLPLMVAMHPEMVRVPGGEFYMGCNEEVDSECDLDEIPGRLVEVGEFWIDTTEVTVADYQRCVEAGQCSGKGLTMPYWAGVNHPGDVEYCNWGKAGREQHPINCVNWHQAVAYCEWAGKRVPTEVEWEKAARGTDGRKYPWGNAGYAEAGPVANICDAACAFDWKDRSFNDGYERTAPVGSYPAGASPYGTLDMVGNVWEWVVDEYGDGRGVRGGSWYFYPRLARVSNQNREDPQCRFGNTGFRCAR